MNSFLCELPSPLSNQMTKTCSVVIVSAVVFVSQNQFIKWDKCTEFSSWWKWFLDNTSTDRYLLLVTPVFIWGKNKLKSKSQEPLQSDFQGGLTLANFCYMKNWKSAFVHEREKPAASASGWIWTCWKLRWSYSCKEIASPLEYSHCMCRQTLRCTRNIQ